MSKEISLQQPGRRVTIGLHEKKEKLNNPIKTTKRLLRYIGSKKISLIIIFLLCAVTTLISILGTRINGIVVDKYISIGDISGLFKICIILVIMYIVSTISTFIQNKLMVNVAQSTSYKIRKDLYEKMQDLPISYYDTHSSGDLMSRLTNDIDNINTTLSQSLTQLISGIINVVGMLIAMLMLNPYLTLIGLVNTPITIFITRKLIAKTQPLFVKKQNTLGDLNGV